jgi:hypothetical protein
MKIEIKTDALCVTIITVATCTAVVATQVYGTQTDFSEGWYPWTIVPVIHLILLRYLAKTISMANNDDKKPPVNLRTKDGNAKKRGGRRQNQNWWNHTEAVPAKKLEGKTPELKGDIFDNTGPHDAANFHKAVKKIADYLQLEHRSNVSNAVHTLTLPPDSEIPEPPTTTLSGIDEISLERET